jgi:hypothetical protein
MMNARLSLLTACLVWAGLAVAGGSSPLLTLTSAGAYASTAGAVGVEARGSFNFEDVVEGVFPAGVVVYQGTHFARIDQAGTVVEGTAPFLGNGLDASEVQTLVGLGGPAGPPAALGLLTADRLTVVLPATFAAGGASVVLYAVFEDAGFASNVLTVTLP